MSLPIAYRASLSPSGVPLLPKLRGYLVEFLEGGSPERLRILISSTCVGLRYGHLHLTRGFSRQCGIKQSASPEGFTSLNASALCNPDLPGLRPARLDCHPIDSCFILLRHPIGQTVYGGTGIFVPVFHRLRLSASA